MRIAALTDHEYTPSSRFRIRQHIAGLHALGMDVVDHPRRWSTQSASRFFPSRRIRSSPAKAGVAAGFELLNMMQTLGRVLVSRGFDATWLSRELVIGYPTFETLLRNPLFYDIDDAIFLNPRTASALRTMLPGAAAVMAGNEYLASYCRQYSARVHVVPTGVDAVRFAPAPRAQERHEFVVGWSGTSSSFKFFASLQKDFVQFFSGHPGAVLKICADRYPHELAELAAHIRYEPWSAEWEAAQIQSFDVGLMPLENSEWSKGKCSYKFLLYAACGVPTICSPVGMNAEVLKLGEVGLPATTPTEWRDALEYCFAHRDSLITSFPDCRRIIVERFSADAVRRQIGDIMQRGGAS